MPISVRSHILYRYTCDGCNAIYLGKTRRHYGVRVFEHLGISLLTPKKYIYNPRNSNNSAILNHINCNSMCIGKEETFLSFVISVSYYCKIFLLIDHL